MSLKVSSAPDASGQTGVVAAGTVKTIWRHVTRVFKCWSQREVVGFLLGSRLRALQLWPQIGSMLPSEAAVLECAKLHLKQDAAAQVFASEQLECCLRSLNSSLLMNIPSFLLFVLAAGCACRSWQGDSPQVAARWGCLLFVGRVPCHWWVTHQPRWHFNSLYIINIWAFSRVAGPRQPRRRLRSCRASAWSADSLRTVRPKRRLCVRVRSPEVSVRLNELTRSRLPKLNDHMHGRLRG